MINQEISKVFFNMSSYLQMSSEKNAFFRSRAYRKAAEVVEKFPEDLSQPEWYEDTKRLVKLEGIGKGTAIQIKEFVQTGQIQDYEDMKEESPVKLEELLKIQGVGPKKILKLYKELGVTDIKTLKQAAETDQIASLEGFGKKSQDNILESIEFAIVNKDRVSIAIAEEEIENIRKYLQQDNNILIIEFAGSYRRKKETIGDIDILVSSRDPVKTMNHFVKYPSTEKILGHGDTKASIWIKAKIQVDIRILDKGNFGAALQYFTGSKEHNVKLRNIAISKGYKLSEYGLFVRDEKEEDKQGKLVEAEFENKIYEKLGMQYIEPELRENEGEIDLALKGNIPQLLEISDLKGDFHTHTTFSDGVNTIEQMVLAAKSKGYEYIGISDHFGALKIAGALDETEFNEYFKSIKGIDEKIEGIKVFASGEVEINKDGDLDFKNELLEQLDYIIASVHLSTKMDKNQMTKRIIKALKNPLTKILAHPTGRIIGQRPGYEFDYKEVFKVAREENVALEINAHPERLDLSGSLSRLAKDMGCKLTINTDSHRIEDLDLMRFGVYIARKGMLEDNDLAEPDSLLL